MDRKDVMADEISTIATDMVDAALKTVKLSIEEQDELWGELINTMEKFFNYPDFRNYN
jgi:hypothetical protein